ncbi:restriction endonuclease subunit S [Neobacillus niacini]|uniref:restriction endonuclease subunit S n=1 Tax=Neobacillus niacini TaxID=86668 RepID=UPI00203D3A06|nr:restriction endonuclease subunit S [Neobacillus niacini]
MIETKDTEFKDSELGKIPKEWQVKSLEELGDAIIGLTYKPEDLVENAGILVLRSSNIRGNKLSFKDNKYVDLDIPNKLLTKENDILICSRNGSKNLIGKCAFINKENEGYSFGAFMTVYRSKYNPFLFHLFNSHLFKKQIFANLGATINQITSASLRSFKFAIPTNKEQKKITSILNSIDKAIEKTEDIIEQSTKVKKGLIQQLLTKGIGHTKFKPTEIGEIPEEWGYVSLEEITIKITDGAHKSPPTYEHGLPIATVENMRNDFLDIESCRTISKEDFDELVGNSCAPVKNDVLLSKDGTIGKTLVFNQESKIVLLSSIAIIRPNLHKLSSEYLMYYLQSNLFYWNLEKFRSGSAIKRIVLKDIKRLAIPLPTIEEQRKISMYIGSIDRKIKTETEKLGQLQSTKKGLMQDLLTGKVRVKVDEEEAITP